MPRLALVLLAAVLGLHASLSQAGPTLAQAIADPARPEADRARDVYRHPQQTLEFFGVQPTHTVVEVWPGSGWYTEILAPYLRDGGHYVAAGFVTAPADAPEWRREMMASFKARLAQNPARYGQPRVTELGLPSSYTAAPAGTADVVLTFRNVHNWLKAGYEAQMFQAFHTALKPGGVLGVVEHRARPGTPLEQMKTSGYVTEAHVIALAEAAGFRLDARSEVNANPKDSTDHPEGVWTLPPTLRLGEKDREKYLAIGESDRMTLRFIKPAR